MHISAEVHIADQRRLAGRSPHQAAGEEGRSGALDGRALSLPRRGIRCQPQSAPPFAATNTSKVEGETLGGDWLRRGATERTEGTTGARELSREGRGRLGRVGPEAAPENARRSPIVPGLMRSMFAPRGTPSTFAAFASTSGGSCGQRRPSQEG